MSDFKADFAHAAGWIDEYFRETRPYPVRAQVAPGDLVAALPGQRPRSPNRSTRSLRISSALILPGITHWNHPRFFAYFAISAAPVAVIAEALAAALDVNAMLWRTSPAASELEVVVTAWLRACSFISIAGCTASSTTRRRSARFHGAGRGREAAGFDIRNRGMAGRGGLARRCGCTSPSTPTRTSRRAPSRLAIGRDNVVRIPVDDDFAMRPDALAAAIDADRARGFFPMCVAATIGTTSTTSRDPIERIARCHEGARRLAARRRRVCRPGGDAAGIGRAHGRLRACRFGRASTRTNGSSCRSIFRYCTCAISRMLRRAFSLAADYLATADGDVRNYMDYGLQLGRRFRALKLWFVLRHYGAAAIRGKLRGHIALAATFAGWVRRSPAGRSPLPIRSRWCASAFRRRGWMPGMPTPSTSASLEAVNADGRGLSLLDAAGRAVRSCGWPWGTSGPCPTTWPWRGNCSRPPRRHKSALRPLRRGKMKARLFAPSVRPHRSAF